MKDKELADSVMLVTGGSSGIGRCTALALAAAGAKVVIGSRSDVSGKAIVDEIRDSGGEALFLSTDVSDPVQCESLVNLALSSYGRLDGAFNNAGVHRDGAMHQTSIDDISMVIDINLKGVLFMMKFEVAAMRLSGGGAIVNNSSIFGLKAMPHLANYVAAKHGVVGATRATALDYAADGIRVNAVCPGPVKTPTFDRVTGGDDSIYANTVPMGRVGQPAEISAAVLWLLGPHSGFVTGAVLSIDGGLSAN